LRTCTEWNELGTPLLWTYIALNNDNLLPFVRSLKAARDTTGALVRNVSIQLSPVSHCSARRDHNAAWVELCPLIKDKLKRLTTFSFHITPLPSNPYRVNTRISGVDVGEQRSLLRVITSLLVSLPKSCVQLELWNICSQDLPNYVLGARRFLPNDHDISILHQAVNKVLPRVTHVHLDDRHVSALVFASIVSGTTLPNVQSMCLDITTMTTIDRLYTAYSDQGPAFALDAIKYLPLPQPAATASNWLRLQNIVAKELRQAYDAGRFPSIQELKLVGMHNPRDVIAGYNVHRLNTVDVLNKHIKVRPFVSHNMLAFTQSESGTSLHTSTKPGLRGHCLVTR
jgi:hypothetical protein